MDAEVPCGTSPNLDAVDVSGMGGSVIRRAATRATAPFVPVSYNLTAGQNPLTGPNPGRSQLPFETIEAMLGGLRAAAVETADLLPVFFLAGCLFGGLVS
jgi:hypothetical protein